MKKDQIKEYTARVAQANRTELVVIIYELILDSIKEGEMCYNKGDLEAGAEHIEKAQAYLQELKGSLDHQYELSGQLFRLYRYVNEQLITTKIRRKPVNLDAACNVIQGLMSSFAEVARQDASGPVMQNTQKVYAGLTYGRGALDEVLMNQDEGSRGFKV
ncbi:MAG: flagellar protein FliS [Lachnospiraceae bacterium]|nr:flagellar protein FliS [Lachnospiraceae bacterium]